MTNNNKNPPGTQQNTATKLSDTPIAQKKENIKEGLKKLGLEISFEELRNIDPEKDIPKFSDLDQASQGNILQLQEEARNLLTPEEQVVEELNKKHAFVHTDSSYILTEKPHPFIKENDDFVLESRQSLIHCYENQLIRCSDGNIKSKAKIWLAHPDRRSYPNGITFDPTTTRHERGFYNLWHGFAVIPKKGSCDLFKRHIQEVICSGNKTYFNYLWKWCAYLCQHPDQIHTAILLMGLQGTGKGIFAKTIGKIFGKHFIHLDSVERLVGNFNFHMKNAVLVFADETIWGGHRKDVGKLKAMVTEELAMIESKGKDTITVRNFRHFIFSSNDEWPVHLDPDDRRMLVLKVSDKHKEDVVYFSQISTELKNGGYEAILHELLDEDLSGFNPRILPFNKEAFSIKMRSASSVEKYIYEVLREGCFDVGNTTPSLCWEEDIPSSSVRDDYFAWCSLQRIPFESEESLGRALSKHCRLSKSRPRIEGGRQTVYVLQNLSIVRTEFQKSFKVGAEIWD